MKMNRQLKRSIRIVFVCVLILCLLPVGIMAETINDRDKEEIVDVIKNNDNELGNSHEFIEDEKNASDYLEKEETNLEIPENLDQMEQKPLENNEVNDMIQEPLENNEENDMTQELLENNKANDMRISTLNEIPDISKTEEINQQIVIIYVSSGNNNVEELNLKTEEIKAGEQISERVDLIEVSDEKNVDVLIEEIKNNPEVLSVDRNSFIQISELPNDYYIQNGDEWQFEDIGADKTWNTLESSNEIVIAVIDSGLNVNHPDLQGRIVAGYDYLNETTEMIDLGGHGTAVSGCISAINNNEIGVAGVVGELNVKIAPYRTGGEYDGDPNLNVAYICAALMSAADRPDVGVINMSFGGYGDYPTLKTAIDYAVNKDKILVASSGNEGHIEEYKGQYAYPASFDGVISVGATSIDDEYAYFSQYNDKVDFVAPGYGVYTTLMDGGYAAVTGTSFSSPITAGVCAVILSIKPDLTASDVESLIKETALDLGEPGYDIYCGNGLVQLDKAVEKILPLDSSVKYRTHVQDYGWQDYVSNGEMSGTTGESKRLEGINIEIFGNQNLGIEYKTHVQDYGWQGFVSNGEMSGTSGESKRLEAIKIGLTDIDADKYDIYYCVHAQDYGWLDWAMNGEAAGTEGLSKRLEGIKIKIVLKGTDTGLVTERPFVSSFGIGSILYRTHVQDYGWQDYVNDGIMSGTSGKAKRLEGINIRLGVDMPSGSVVYSTHVQDYGWMKQVSDGTMSGTLGESKRLEAIRINLTDEVANQYDIYYRAHAQNIGWLDWAKNGQDSGSAGFSYRLEGIEIKLVEKDGEAPGSTERPFVGLADFDFLSSN